MNVKTRGLQRMMPWILPLGVLLAWQILTQYRLIGSNILPRPIEVFRACADLLYSGDLLRYIVSSAKRALAGFLIGGSIGFSLGLITGVSGFFEKILDASIQMLRNIPHLALIPLIILWFGIGEEAKIVLVALGVFFPIYLNTYHGIRSIDSGLLEMGRVYGLRGLSLFRNIVLPGSLPSILVGVRYALGIMWLTLIVAETVAADSGIGYMAMNAREYMQMDVIVLSVIIYALLGKLSDSLAKGMEKRWLQWHPNFKKEI